MESVLCYQFAVKKNRHGKDDKRFCMFTSSCLYLCSQNKILRIMKVSRSIPWVDLKRLTLEDKAIIFEFKSGRIEITVERPEEMVEKLVEHLYAMFGRTVLPFQLSISPLVVLPQDDYDRFLAAYLYVSYSVSMSIGPSEHVFNILKRVHDDPCVSLDYCQLVAIDHRAIHPLLASLQYARNILSLKVPGNGVHDFWNQMKDLVIANGSLESLWIEKSDGMKGFQEFVEVLPRSYLNALTLVGVKFDIETFTSFVENLKDSCITILRFSRCPFNKPMAEYMLREVGHFGKLATIGVNGTDFMVTNEKKNELFSVFFDFLFASKIPSVELVNDGLDISDVFAVLDQAVVPMISLDLSQNICSQKFTGHYVLPITLTDLKLAGIDWSGTGLHSLLSNQQYVNAVTLDVSGQRGAKVKNIHKALKPGPSLNIQTLVWNSNALSAKFFEYLESLDRLEKLSIDECTAYVADKDDGGGNVLNLIVMYLQNARIKEFSIRGGPNSPYQNLARELFAVIAVHQTLEAIDVSGNSIGDSGLELLVDCLSRNTQIQRVEFDGSNLQSPDKFIECCTRMSEMTHLKYIGKPQKELDELARRVKSKEQAAAIQAAWDKLENAVKANNAKESAGSRPLSLGLKQLTKQNASWEIEIPVKYNREKSKWDELSDEFSLERLTGIPPDEQEALIDL